MIAPEPEDVPFAEPDWGEELLELAGDMADNPEPRCPGVLLLDTSSSMAGEGGVPKPEAAPRPADPVAAGGPSSRAVWVAAAAIGAIGGIVEVLWEYQPPPAESHSAAAEVTDPPRPLPNHPAAPAMTPPVLRIVPQPMATEQKEHALPKATANLRADPLQRTWIDLTVRIVAFNRQVQALQERAVVINAMPPGIERDAASTAYEGDLAELQLGRDAIARDSDRFKEDVADYSQRLREENRRAQAARAANQLRPGDSVQVEWGGQWWKATVLRAENGRYSISYTGYGSEWDEWVDASRIRRQ
jgi:hypothetical protein